MSATVSKPQSHADRDQTALAMSTHWWLVDRPSSLDDTYLHCSCRENAPGDPWADLGSEDVS